MTTTFLSREAVRDEIAAFFVADGSWQNVYGYFPGVDDIKGKTPICIIRSRGTQMNMQGVVTNPTQYRFLISSWVLAYSANSADSYTSATAEDKLDELDKVVRQLIRDNTTGTNYNNLLLDGGFSEVDDVIIEGVPYIVETRSVTAHLYNGAV